MLIQSQRGGGTYGFGATAANRPLTQGTDYNCNASICYAIGAANDALFKKLQQGVNMLASAAGIAPIIVDGWIGKETVAALQALTKLGFNATMYKTNTAIARDAHALIAQLASLAATSGAAATAALQPGQLPGSSPAAAAAALPTLKGKTLWWIVGGLATVLAVGGVGYVVYRRKARGY